MRHEALLGGVDDEVSETGRASHDESCLVKLGLFLPLIHPIATPDFIAEAARTAERYGFHRVWLADPHVVSFDHYSSRHPYTRHGRWPPMRQEPDSFLALTYMAAATGHIRFGTAVCLVPQRHPLYTAKAVTTLDHFSEGRFDFGVGLGVAREEYDAVGVAWERRGDRCRSYIELMLTLWQGSDAAFDSDFYSLSRCRQRPEPLQKPHPPIYFAGESDAALNRVADLGQGWLTVDLRPSQAFAALRKLEPLVAARGRTRADVDVSLLINRPNLTPDVIMAYAEAGVDELVPRVTFNSQEEIEPKLASIAALIAQPRES